MAKEKPQLAAKLSPYGLSEPTPLATAIGVSRQYAHQLLSGERRMGVKVAKRIGEAIGLPFSLVLEWQENGR